MLTDSHAHIHFEQFADDLEHIFARAREARVDKIICVGTTAQDSKAAFDFVTNKTNLDLAKNIELYSTAGLHPHEASLGSKELQCIKEIIEGSDTKIIVAVGECGLDYYKNFSSKADQHKALEMQLQIAIDTNLPVVFHIRDAWDDFFAILANFSDIRGVIHSFTGQPQHVEMASKYDLYFGLNGIMTFTKDQQQLEAAKAVPSARVLLETDCPFLAPVPYRGKQNEPSYIVAIADFLAVLRNSSSEELASVSSSNAKKLFSI